MKRNGERGMVLMAVLFFVLISSATIATFLTRATVDGFSAQNRDGAARLGDNQRIARRWIPPNADRQFYAPSKTERGVRIDARAAGLLFVVETVFEIDRFRRPSTNNREIDLVRASVGK